MAGVGVSGQGCVGSVAETELKGVGEGGCERLRRRRGVE